MEPIPLNALTTKDGYPLRPADVYQLSAHFNCFGRVVKAEQLLVLDQKQLKAARDEASDALTICDKACKAAASETDRDKHDRQRKKWRKLYNMITQCYRIRKAEWLGDKSPSERLDIMLYDLHKTAKIEGWSLELLHLRETHLVSAFYSNP